jgi:predicted RNA-binding Zn-ribbon protein involved in translation (DUF1610 family)
MAARGMEACIRCERKIQIGESAVAYFMYCQTVGIKRRQKSKSERLYLCPQCAVVVAMGAKPGNGALNVAAYRMLRGLVGKDPAVTEKAWEELHQVSGPHPQLTEGEILPPEVPQLRSA